MVPDAGDVCIYDLPEENKKEGRFSRYCKVAYSADGSRIVYCREGSDAIFVWLIGNRSQPVNRIPIDPGMTLETLSLDCEREKMVALLIPEGESESESKGGGEGEGVPKPAVVRYWNLDTGEEIKSLQITTNLIYGAVFAKMNTMLVTNHYPEKMYVWNLEGDRATLGTTIDVCNWSFDVTRSGDIIAVGCEDYAIRFYSAHTGAELAVYRCHHFYIRSLRFSSEGDHLVSSSNDGTTRVWDTTKEALSAKPPSAIDDCCFKRVKFSSNGKCIAAIAWKDPRIFIWNGETGKYAITLAGHAGSVAAFAFSADDSMLASVSGDGVVVLWVMQQEDKHPRTLSQSNTTESLEPVDMAFNACSNLLAIVYKDDKSFVVKLYDVSNRNRAEAGVETFQSEPSDGYPPHLIRFSPDEPLVRLRHFTPPGGFLHLPLDTPLVRIWDHATKTVQEYAYDEIAHSKWVLPFHVDGDSWHYNDWIYSRRTKMRLFWLPRDRRPSNPDSMDMHGDRLAIGSLFGNFTLLDMSRLQATGNEPA
jgi:WD40 repeat protein